MANLDKQDESALALPGRFLKTLAALGGVVLFAVMFLVSFTVFCRYVLNQPVLGDKELVEMGMALVVMLAMPFATMKGVHIRVDILDNKIGALGRFLGDLLARLLGAYILLLLINKTFSKMLDAYEYNDVTNMIEIPVWIAYGAITAGMGCYALVLIWQFIDQLRSGVNGYE